MMKHAYRRTPINNFQPLAVQNRVSERRLVLAIDVAKQDRVA
jgi:hypothetical protein